MMAETNPSPQASPRARSEFAAAAAAVRSAVLAVGLFADSVSEEVEQRLGVSCEDPVRYEDPHYSQALDLVGLIGQTLTAVNALAPLYDDETLRTKEE